MFTIPDFAKAKAAGKRLAILTCYDAPNAALERAPADRAAFLSAACAGDESLRRDVAALLTHAETAEGFLAMPLDALAAQALTGPESASFVGRQLGVYQILSLLGSGGMGDVYRARDTKLGRDVALKILPYAFTNDPERLARFRKSIERQVELHQALAQPRPPDAHCLERKIKGIAGDLPEIDVPALQPAQPGILQLLIAPHSREPIDLVTEHVAAAACRRPELDHHGAALGWYEAPRGVRLHRFEAFERLWSGRSAAGRGARTQGSARDRKRTAAPRGATSHPRTR